MRLTCVVLAWCVCATGWFGGNICVAEDLIQAHDGLVRYKLSNLRVDKGVTRDQIAFDYKRTREGDGTAQLVARTDEGKSRILGLPIRIEESGTIRLRDMFSHVRGQSSAAAMMMTASSFISWSMKDRSMEVENSTWSPISSVTES